MSTPLSLSIKIRQLMRSRSWALHKAFLYCLANSSLYIRFTLLNLEVRCASWSRFRNVDAQVFQNLWTVRHSQLYRLAVKSQFWSSHLKGCFGPQLQLPCALFISELHQWFICTFPLLWFSMTQPTALWSSCRYTSTADLYQQIKSL